MRPDPLPLLLSLPGVGPENDPVHWATRRRYGSPVVVPVILLRRIGLKELLATCKRFCATAKKRGRQSTT